MDVEKRQAVIDWLNNFVNSITNGQIEVDGMRLEAQTQEVTTSGIRAYEVTGKRTVHIDYTAYASGDREVRGRE